MRFGTAPGLYAIEPQALGLECIVDMARNAAPHEIFGRVAVVQVHGPLSYSPGLTEAYGNILTRVRAAFADARDPHTVIMHLDSPGGDVSGAFDNARMLRASVPAGKRLVAYTDSKCCSSAYAQAVAASEIYCSSTAIVGSIGVICAMQSLAAAAAAQGVQTAVITSGSRKADGNPLIPITDEAVAAAQLQVDVMAAEFFRLVGEARQMGAAGAQALEAAVFVGAAAQAAGLVDGVTPNLETLIESLQSGPVAAESAAPRLSGQADATEESPSMADEDKTDKKEDATRAALVTASESDDSDKAARAKKALAAYDAEVCEDDSDEKKKKDEEAKAAAAIAAAAPLAAQVQTLSAKLAEFEKREAAKAEADFYAAHPELDAGLVATLKTMPLAQAQAIVAKLPKAGPTAASLAAQPSPVAGAGQDGTAMRSDPESQARLNAAFGETVAKLAKAEFNSATNVQTFGRVAVAPKGEVK